MSNLSEEKYNKKNSNLKKKKKTYHLRKPR